MGRGVLGVVLGVQDHKKIKSMRVYSSAAKTLKNKFLKERKNALLHFLKLFKKE